PIEIDDDLVEAALVHEIKDSRVEGSQATCLLTATPARGVPPNPERWARVVVRAMQRFKRDPDAAFYLAALPAKEAAWGGYMKRLDDAHGALPGVWNPKAYDTARRERVLRPLASDAAVVAGARAAARLKQPRKYDGWWWVLAADGSAESLPLLEVFVKKLGKSPKELDWLASDFAPLMTSKPAAALRARLIRTVDERSARSPGLAVARDLGIETDALRFKVGLYADRGMPRIRLWVDSAKDPWFDARWNWDELVHPPKSPKGTSPIDRLRAFLRSCVKDGKGEFRMWELATAHRGDAKTRLVEFLAAELKGLAGPKPPSAPLKSFKG
ncbi:MAG TPA: hypothetical protein VF316_13580, partial [Polyangiaceae bacterium]